MTTMTIHGENDDIEYMMIMIMRMAICNIYDDNGNGNDNISYMMTIGFVIRRKVF